MLAKKVAQATNSTSEQANSHQVKEQELIRTNAQLRRQIQQAIANERAAHEARIGAEQAMASMQVHLNFVSLQR
jgi:hypothetical protein